MVEIIERAGGKCLVDRYVDAADPGPIHADMGHKIAAFVDNRDVHGLADFSRSLFSGVDNLACFLQCDHRDPYAQLALQASVQTDPECCAEFDPCPQDA